MFRAFQDLPTWVCYTVIQSGIKYTLLEWNSILLRYCMEYLVGHSSPFIGV